ncbi:MAG TPA: DUF3108 domain-containing protein [Rhizomicrobium sp.]|nr:DUF3108 domain-containing protein [Rhizomicrobium sp.]
MPEFRFGGLVLAALVAAVAPLPAAAQDPQAPRPTTLDVGYSIAFWGIAFGHTDYDGKFAGGAYDSKSHFETSGIVSVFWNSTIDAVANGRVGAHSIAPNVYDSYSQDHNSKRQRVKVTFEDDDPTTFADPPYNTTKYPVSEEQKKGAVDPMSAITTILAGVKADTKNPCGAGVQVFDGRRRYDVTFTYLGDEKASVPGVWSGNVHKCQIHYNQIAGYKQKIVKEGKALPPMFADFADVPAAGAPNGRFVVAVRLWSALSWGTVTATIDQLKVDGAAAKS